MSNRTDFFAELDDEVRRQLAVKTAREADEAVPAEETRKVVGRLKTISSEYVAWAQRNGLIANVDESAERLSLEIAENRNEKWFVTFHRDLPGHYAVTVVEPFDDETDTVTIPSAVNTPISKWRDDLFEDELRTVMRKLIDKRGRRFDDRR